MANLTVSKTVLVACETCEHDFLSCWGQGCKHFNMALVKLHDYEETGLLPDDIQAIKRQRFDIESKKAPLV